MHSTSDPKQADPDGDVWVASVTEGLAKAVARGPEPLSRVQEPVSKLEHDAVRYSSDQQIPVNTFRPTVPRDRPARRGLIGLLLAACIFVAAFALHSSYGDAVRPIIVRWAPPLVPTSSQLLEKPRLSAQPSPASVQAAAAEPIPPQPTPSAQTAPQDIAPTTAPVSPEGAQLLQTIVRDSQTWSKGSTSSRPAKIKWPATMPRPLSSSRRARTKWHALSPRLPSGPRSPRYQRLRRAQWPPRRVSRCQRVRRRKPARSRRRQCSRSPTTSSCHRRRGRLAARSGNASSAAEKVFGGRIHFHSLGRVLVSALRLL